MSVISIPRLLALACSVASLGLFVVNLRAYKPPRAPRHNPDPIPQVSVLIPARNEEAGIVAAARSVLASTGVELELLILDDSSSDRTAELVSALAQRDPRVQPGSAPALPAGWNGKQHACFELARRSRFPLLCFLDADVRLAPTALASLCAELEARDADLLSGFPREETFTFLEKLLIPLIHFVLLCYLPLPLSDKDPRNPALAAGCGQLMLVRRSAYQACGGHGSIRATMHDGLLLPRLFRRHGFSTALCDLTQLASCRMYSSAGDVWRGLGKNATEGMAAPRRILPFSALLFFGHVAPAILLVSALRRRKPLAVPALAVAAGYAVRLTAALRFRQSFLSALLHPVSVAVLLALQWSALVRKLTGRPAVWKQRVYEVG